MQVAVADPDCVSPSVSGLEQRSGIKRTGMQGLVNVTDKMQHPAQGDCARRRRCGSITQHRRVVVNAGNNIGYLLFAVYLAPFDAINIGKCVDAQIDIPWKGAESLIQAPSV